MFRNQILLLLLILQAIVTTEAQSQTDQTKQKCQPGSHWRSAHPRSSTVRSDGTPVSGSDVDGSCVKNPKAYKVWINRLQAGLPPVWEKKNEKVKAWKIVEKEKVIEALSTIPNQLLLDSIKGIYRLELSSDHLLNPAASHQDQIVLYDAAFKETGVNLARILAHEFAHQLYRQFYDEDKGVSYALAADWKSFKNPQTNETFLVMMRDEIVAQDSLDGPAEDFSNNIEYFLFEPEKLKKKAPKVYDWIRKRYGDKFKLGQEK